MGLNHAAAELLDPVRNTKPRLQCFFTRMKRRIIFGHQIIPIGNGLKPEVYSKKSGTREGGCQDYVVKAFFLQTVLPTKPFPQEAVLAPRSVV